MHDCVVCVCVLSFYVSVDLSMHTHTFIELNYILESTVILPNWIGLLVYW